MASISGTSAAWDAIYNDRFAEEDARLKAECERLLGLQQDSSGQYTSPEAANHINEQFTNDLLQAERGRRPYPVDQERTAAQDRRSGSVEGGRTQPQLNAQADAAVGTEIPDQSVSKQTPINTTSIALNRSGDVITGGGSQLKSSTKVAQSITLHSGITLARSNVTGGHQFATLINNPAAKRGCLSSFINMQPRKQAKTTRSHRPRLRPKTRWKSASSTTPNPPLHYCFIVILSSSSVLFYDQQDRRKKQQYQPPRGVLFFPDGPATTTLLSNIPQHKQHLQVPDCLMEAHQRYFHHVDLH